MDNDTRTRLFQEHSELRQRLDQLVDFIMSNEFDTLPEHERAALVEQSGHMRSYLDVLTRRTGWECGNA